MTYRSPLRASTVAIVAAFGLALSVACGSTSGSSGFDDGDAGDDSGKTNTSSGSFGNPDAGASSSSGGNGDDDDGGNTCVGDACAPVTAVCGDSKLDPGEACDDGNGKPGDGCSGTCQTEPGYTCPTVGEACVYTIKAVCGNGKIEGEEACDDGNTNDLDGCSAGCEVEPGYSCATPSAPCTKTIQPRCGDGTVDFGEQCDDGNSTAADGCSDTCQVETGFTCPTPGSLCIVLEYCGDKIVQNDAKESETCDDGNSTPGDGCSGVCLLEPGYSCTTPGQKCTKIWVCGNGKVDPGESCDDGNTTGGDGCTADCGQAEPGYTCPSTGGTCTKQTTATCGDSKIAGTEQCDDGNTTSGDGCSATCAIESGFTCPTAGTKCTPIVVCGDGKLGGGEQCDDKNTTSGDGCSSTCVVEPFYQCLTVGAKCTYTVKCGDGKVQDKETCDDGNQVSGDGCSSTCVAEKGFTCPVGGVACAPTKCGDGFAVGTEQCDDGNTANNDGCSSTCQIEVKIVQTPGSTTVQPVTTTTEYVCTPPAPETTGKQTCSVTTCGNGKLEGSEQCDDGNTKAYDGCSPSCTLEPHCPRGTCIAICGDGLLTNYDTNGDGKPDEACDDGNTLDGDGCSSTCQVESGYTCTNGTGTAPTTIDVPVVFRDFKYWSSGDASSHPDFETYACSVVSPNLVDARFPATTPTGASLGGAPTFNTTTNGAGASGCGTQMTSQADFADWYRDVTVNDAATGNTDQTRYKRVDGHQLELVQQADGSYVFDSAADQPWATYGGFFPIDSDANTWGIQSDNHNFSFSTEFRYWFTYDKTQQPTLDFSGDDDVWVFINGHLALDLGGLHSRLEQNFTLTTANATAWGLADGHLYEIALFHAERHTTASNFKLTLKGFVKNTSVCKPVCGDGVQTRTEQCDFGNKNATPAPYGGCSKSCTLGGYCGDKTIVGESPPETCDDGVNNVTYGGTTKSCGPSCTFAPYCGDGTISNGEQCDDGTAKNTGAYGACSKTCTLGARCGDGTLNGPTGQEQCDDGVNNGQGADKCNSNCTLRCGDGKLEAGEACDDGTAKNTGGYGKCNADCTKGPYCGDGIQTAPEKCDDGKNDGSYGTCKNDCSLANYCGDGTLTNPPETCDLGGSNSATAYGKSTCTNRCTPGPYCGDKAVDGVDGEVCDDGKDDGSPGSCTADCKNFVPFLNCGNGTVDTGEQCDDGKAKNGTAGDACDAHCHKTCGNGIVDTANGETCDNGVNDGSYGGCTPTCQIGPYCGDGVKNGTETCDNGNGNVPAATAYGFTICTTACSFAGYCGDGRIQANHGEQCDGGNSCDGSCKTTGPK